MAIRAAALDANGFYAPGSWTQDQLIDFAKELDPSPAPAGRSSAIDLGIVRAVKVLSDAGVETFESCQGGDGHAFAEPVVRFHGAPAEGWRALSLCATYGFPVLSLRRYWTVS